MCIRDSCVDLADDSFRDSSARIIPGVNGRVPVVGREFVGSRCGAGGGDGDEPLMTGILDSSSGMVVVKGDPGPVAAGDCMVSLACCGKRGVSGEGSGGDGIGSTGVVDDVNRVNVGC